MQRIPTMTTKPFWGMMNIILLALLLCGTSAWAGTLENLRASGAIGESNDGYVVAREPGARADADAINAKRKTIYQEKATAQGIGIDQVGKVYAEEIFKNVPAGTWIQLNGNWTKK